MSTYSQQYSDDSFWHITYWKRAATGSKSPLFGSKVPFFAKVASITAGSSQRKSSRLSFSLPRSPLSQEKIDVGDADNIVFCYHLVVPVRIEWLWLRIRIVSDILKRWNSTLGITSIHNNIPKHQQQLLTVNRTQGFRMMMPLIAAGLNRNKFFWGAANPPNFDFFESAVSATMNILRMVAVVTCWSSRKVDES